MAVTTTGLIVAGLALTAIGGGITAYNSFQSAATAKNVANYNYAMQQRQLKMQLMGNTAQVQQMQQQARFQKAQSEINARLAESEAKARENNAQSIRNQALAQASVDRENIRRSNLDAQRQIARMRASQAASGGQLDAGSMLETVVESEEQRAGITQELAQQSELGYRKSFGEAALEDFGAAMARSGAQLDLATGLAEADLMRKSASIKEVEVRSAFLMGRRQSEIDRMAGYASAKGSQLAGWGSLFQTAGSVASGWANWNYLGGGGWGGKGTLASGGWGRNSYGQYPAIP